MKSYPIPTPRKPMAIFAGLLLAMAIISGGVAQAAPSQYNMRCDDCHEMPPLDSPTGKRDPDTGAFKGNHQSHSSAAPLTCAKCHGAEVVTKPYQSGHQTKDIKVTGNLNNSPLGATYSRSFFNQTSVPPNPMGTCSNVNCHFEALSPAWGAASYNSPADCGVCHGSSPADGNHPSASGAGKKHGDYYGTGAASCGKCHPDHTAEAKPFSHATSAGSRALGLSFTGGGSYSKPGNLAYPNYLPSQTLAASRNGSCDNTYCHSNGAGQPPVVTAVWGGSLPGDCTGCHGGNAQSGSIIGTGSHLQHVANAAPAAGKVNLGANYACASCHNLTVTGNDTTVGNLANHVNGSREVAFSGSGSYGAPNCSATVCHSAGKSAAPQPAAPAWGGAALSCTGCHGANGGVGGFTSEYGEPSYANAGPGADLANSHSAKHMVKSAASCANCHFTATADGISIKNGFAGHADGNINVSFAPSYALPGAAYDGSTGNKSCSATYCHSDGNNGAPIELPKWGGKTSCRSCHGGDAASAAPIATMKHAAHMNNYSTLGRGNDLLCAACHAKTVGFGNNTTITEQANHVNLFKDYSGAMAGGSANYAGRVCSNVYCHSSGQAVPVFRSMTGSKAWDGTSKLSCNGCHGYGGGSFVPVAGEPNYPSAAGAENSHEKHTIGAGMADSRGCAVCHRTTVDRGVAGKLRDYSSAHVNGLRDVSFAVIANYTGHYTAAKNCANTYCHGAGNSVAWGTPGPLSCASCHKADATLAGRHGAHWESTTPATSYTATAGNLTGSATNYNFECSSCHAGVHAQGPAADGNGNAAEVFFNYTAKGLKGSYSYGSTTALDGTLKWSDGTCSSTYCHSRGDGREGLGTAGMTWASPAKTLRCDGCHGGDASKTDVIDTNLHRAHIDPLANASLGTGNGRKCGECHAATVSFTNNTTLTDKRKHINKFREYTGLLAGGSSYVAATKSCTNVYCHSNGKRGTSVNQYLDPVAWTGSATLSCNGCHGQAAVADFASDPNHGAPNYANSGAVGSGTSNSHKLHVQKMGITSSNACYVCHAKTVDRYASLKLRPYSSMHITGGTNIVFGKMSTAGFKLMSSVAKAAYVKATMTCTTVTCHSDGKGRYQSAQWGAVSNCGMCHPMNKLSRGHAFHVYTSASNTPTVYANFTANRSVAARYNYGCANCHPVNNPNHMKGTVLIDLYPGSANAVGYLRSRNGSGITVGSVPAGTAGSGTIVAGNSLTCANVYCHSNGYASNLQYQVTPDWYAGSFTGDRCANCHGNWPNAGAIPGSPSHYNGNWSGSGTAGGHAVGIHSAWTANADPFTGIAGMGTAATAAHGNGAYTTTVSCNTCHYATVTSPVNGTSAQCNGCHVQAANKAQAIIADKSMHVTGTVNVTFQSSALQTRAQLRGSSFATVSSSTLWHRSGNYKAPGSFDVSKRGLNAGSYVGGNCSNVVCHFNKPVTWSTPSGFGCQSCHTSM